MLRGKSRDPHQGNGVLKIFFQNQRNWLLILILCFFSQKACSGVTTKSELVSAAIPAIGLVYSFTLGDFEGIKELTISCLVTAQLTTLLKNSVQRQRPNGTDDMSFPSGHAASAFVGASYLEHRYGLAWGLPMYAIAIAICVERVNVKDHYWSDVIAGAAIGYTAAAFFTVECPNVWVAPIIDTQNHFYGLKFNTHFG